MMTGKKEVLYTLVLLSNEFIENAEKRMLLQRNMIFETIKGGQEKLFYKKKHASHTISLHSLVPHQPQPPPTF